MGPVSPQEPAATVATPFEMFQAPAPSGSERRIFGSAGESSTKIGERAQPETNLTGVFVATLLVLALVGAGALLLRRFLRGSRLFAGPGAIRVLARRSIAPKQDVLVVEVGSRLLVVGATRESLTRLGEITSGEEVAQFRARCGESREPMPLPAMRAPRPEAPRGIAGPVEPEADPAAGAYGDVLKELSEIRTAVRGWREDGA